MPAYEKLRECQLDQSLADLQDQIRAEPAKAEHRIFLFQLLAIRGEWDRALTQLNVAAELDPAVLAMAQMYREALPSEAFRTEVFAGRRSPVVFGEPAEWVGLLIESLRVGAEGRMEASSELRDLAFEAAPTIAGTIDDKPFEWIADADPRLGPMLEAIVNGRYYWIPFENVQEIVIEEPADLRDLVWMPAHFRWTNEGEAVGLIPTRYAGSETDDDDQIRLARKTCWIDQGNDMYVGRGQRMLATDGGEFPLMDVRRLVLEVPGNA